MTRTLVWLLAIAVAGAFLAVCAQADSLTVTLTQVSQSTTPGSTVTFDATVTNTSSTDTTFLNGDSWITSSPLLTIDDTPFLANFPLSLPPGESSGPLALFDVIIDPSAIPQTYDFNSFSILGGSDENSFDAIGTTNFSVSVANVTATPECPSFVMFVLGLLLIGCARTGSHRWLPR